MTLGKLDSTVKDLTAQVGALTKSFAAGYPGLQNAGRTGISALAQDHLDDVLRSITMEDKDFLLTKNIPTLKATQSVYNYRVKTAIRSGVDLAGTESFLPQEDASQYMRVAEVLKVYGIRKSITQMAQFINDGGGYGVDLEKENDINAAIGIAEAIERDGYTGGDYFMTSQGDVDFKVAADPNHGSIRQLRGIQANIRQGDQSARGIPGDFIGYGNNRSVVFDRAGAVMERAFLDKVVTAVRDSRGAIHEGHCTTSQLAEFRATFFPIERANINDNYAINGAAVTNDEHGSFTVSTVGGPLNFVPTVFKYNRLTPESVAGSGQPPATPSIASVVAGATIGQGSGFEEGETYRYRVQAVNINGISPGSASSAIVVAAGDDDKSISVTINNVAGAEYYMVFRSPVESSGEPGTEFFCGKVMPQAGATTVFTDNGRLVSGLDSILFLPKDKNRVKMANLGNTLNKLELGVRGLAHEVVYASYLGLIVERPRSLALVDNVFQQREGL